MKPGEDGQPRPSGPERRIAATLWLLMIVSLFMSGCAGHGTWSSDPIFLTQPGLVIKGNKTVSLSRPLLLSVVDEQANEGDYARTRDENYAAVLTTAIVSAYPNAMKAATKAGGEPGSALVVIRIRRLGAYVNRSGRESMLGPVDPEIGEIGDWSAVIAAAADTGPTSFGTRYARISNNWSGVANIDVVVTELGPGGAASFHLPIVAERFVQNDFGALRATWVADSAWDNVAPRLARFLDAAVEKLSADEQGRPARKP
jgi:hypothetical protein